MDLIASGKSCIHNRPTTTSTRLYAYRSIFTYTTTVLDYLPGANIPSGPGFVDKSNASSVSALAGIDR